MRWWLMALWAVVLFVGAALVDAMVTVIAFKMFGGCPMVEKNKRK